MVLAVQPSAAATAPEALMCGRCRSKPSVSVLDTLGRARPTTVPGTPVAGPAEARERAGPIDSLPPEVKRQAHGARPLDAKH